ncbi:hypothetical protein F5Y18DRAFT_383067 [Xylariaceae sp. FL1019]|nr:hypothetical protein F5Y18DRAFT_383067 [Xylariaceae sp. FL1019]
MSDGVSVDAAARASEQARRRKERREAKIKAGGSLRLDKITGLGGGIPKDAPSQSVHSGTSTPSKPTTPAPTNAPSTAPSSDHHADPEEVDISQHFYQPQTANRVPSNNAANMSEAQLRQMMLGFDRPSPAGTPPTGRNPFGPPPPPGMEGMEGMEGMGQDPMMQMLQKMMGGAGGMPGMGMPGAPDSASGNPLAGLESLFPGGIPGMPGSSPMQTPQTEANKSANLWRILHAILALGLGIYVAFTTTFTGTKVERETDELRATGLLGQHGIDQARQWFFYIFTSVEAVLLTSRFMMQKSGGFQPTGWTWSVSGMLPNPYQGYVRHMLRYAEIFSTVRNDALFCVFVMGVCSLLRG